MVELMEKLGNIPLQQSTDFGYIGMIERPDIYALTGADPWIDHEDLGPHQTGVNGTINAIQQHDLVEIYNANKLVFDSQTNIRRANL